MKDGLRRAHVLLAGVGVLVAVCAALVVDVESNSADGALTRAEQVAVTTNNYPTTTPIKHVVVIFDENVSFDHYFGTYPDATNTDGEPFYAAPGTPSVNGYLTSTGQPIPALTSSNPNGSNPARLDPGNGNSNVSNILTCDQNHDYTPEQFAFDDGKMDMFTASNGTATATGTSPTGKPCVGSVVMDYYDGNTVTAEWNYAQHFAMSDNNFGSTFGPSTPGALNLVSGNTGGVDIDHMGSSVIKDGYVVGDYSYPYSTSNPSGYTVIGDGQPYWDDCSTPASALALTGSNVGDQLNAHGLSWGWFQGGFTPASAYTGTASTASNYSQATDPNRIACSSTSNVGAAVGGNGTNYGTDANYSAHYDAFQFYASTANPHHLAPASLDVVGTDTATPGEFDTANHNYDASEFNALVSAIQDGSLPASHLPAVSFLKAPVYETGHPATSDPIDEQVWLVNEINAIEQLPTWKSTAIFVTYDDSDGWYDHVFAGASGVQNPSLSAADTLSAATSTPSGVCGPATQTAPPLDNEQGRCGYGPRLPLIVISTYAKQNYVSNSLTDQSSILAFIEQNWSLGQIPGSFANIAGSVDDLFNFSAAPSALAKPLLLNPQTGEPSYPVVGAISPTSAKPASTVTITGMNFSTTLGQTSVYFGNEAAKDVTCQAATTMAAPATTCAVLVPQGSSGQTVPITVKVNGTSGVDDAGNFTYS